MSLNTKFEKGWKTLEFLVFFMAIWVPPLLLLQKKIKKSCFVFPKYYPKWCKHHKKWQHTVLWDIKKQYYIIPTISTPNHHTQRIATTSSSILNLNTPTILHPVGFFFLSFLKEDKTDQAGRCIKSSIITKLIDYVLSIDTFGQQCVVLKGMFQSPLLKDNVQTIGIEQSLINNAIYEHKCLENIKKLYKQAGKCDDHRQL